MHWANGNTAVGASWTAPTGGDSLTDSYEVHAVPQEAPGSVPAVDQVFASAATSQTVTVATNTYDWVVTVRAHDAAGWGPWSACTLLASL